MRKGLSTGQETNIVKCSNTCTRSGFVFRVFCRLDFDLTGARKEGSNEWRGGVYRRQNAPSPARPPGFFDLTGTARPSRTSKRAAATMPNPKAQKCQL